MAYQRKDTRGAIGHAFLRDRFRSELRANVSRLTALVHADLRPLELRSDFAAAAQTAFKKSYAENFYGESVDMLKSRTLFASSGNWIFRDAALTACENIYQHITTSTA